MTPTFEQQSLLMFIIGLFAVLGAASSMTAIFKNIALARSARNPVRSPPAEEEAARTYATKNELATVKCEFQAQCRINHDRVDKTLGELFSINRNLTQELTARLDAYHKELAEWQRSLERQIGNIEGRMQQ